MKTTLKVISIIAIACGVLAIPSAFEEASGDTFLGIVVLIGWGIVSLLYIKEQNSK